MSHTFQILLFLFCISVVLFWRLPNSMRYGFLAAMSFVMLLFLDPIGVAAFGVISVVFFFIAKQAGRHPEKTWLTPTLIISLVLYLIYFKYVPRLIGAVADTDASKTFVPLGISYFTFKLIHFAVEIRRKTLANPTFADFACYVYLFPIFTAGPIERFEHFIANRTATWNSELAVEGVWRIIYGLIKKFVGATAIMNLIGPGDQLERFANRLISANISDLWVYALLMYLYVYLDFSAYSDMAIGASRLFGIRIAENFNWPLISSNIVEFWQRWHITLRTWCQSYVYLPTIALWRNPYVALYLTFITMGLWHEGSWKYLCWGVYQATGVAVFQAWRRTQVHKRWVSSYVGSTAVVGVVVTNAFICGSHVLAVASEASVADRLRILVKMFLFVTI